jgi:4'-phosphopantetheinyl transferase
MALSAIGLHPFPLPALQCGEVHIWHAHLHLVSQSTQRLFSTLRPDERARAESFRFEKDRNRYATARGILRSLLGRYQGADPGRLEFSYGPFGKPFLAFDSHESTLHFNVSHARDLAVFAFSRDQEIGIDLESIQPHFDFEHLAKSFLPPAELAELHSYAVAERLPEFFRLWTRTEAYAKARGVGLSLLDNGAACSGPRAVLTSRHRYNLGEEISDWTIRHFSPEPDFVAAIAAKTNAANIKHYAYRVVAETSVDC